MSDTNIVRCVRCAQDCGGTTWQVGDSYPVCGACAATCPHGNTTRKACTRCVSADDDGEIARLTALVDALRREIRIDATQVAIDAAETERLRKDWDEARALINTLTPAIITGQEEVERLSIERDALRSLLTAAEGRVKVLEGDSWKITQHDMAWAAVHRTSDDPRERAEETLADVIVEYVDRVKALEDLLQRGPAQWDCYCHDDELVGGDDMSEDVCFPCAVRAALNQSETPNSSDDPANAALMRAEHADRGCKKCGGRGEVRTPMWIAGDIASVYTKPCPDCSGEPTYRSTEHEDRVKCETCGGKGYKQGIPPKVLAGAWGWKTLQDRMNKAARRTCPTCKGTGAYRSTEPANPVQISHNRPEITATGEPRVIVSVHEPAESTADPEEE